MRRLASYSSTYGPATGHWSTARSSVKLLTHGGERFIRNRARRSGQCVPDGEVSVNVSGPDRYRLTITPSAFVVECSRGTPHFSGIATSKKPKLRRGERR